MQTQQIDSNVHQSAISGAALASTVSYAFVVAAIGVVFLMIRAKE